MMFSINFLCTTILFNEVVCITGREREAVSGKSEFHKLSVFSGNAALTSLHICSRYKLA